MGPEGTRLVRAEWCQSDAICKDEDPPTQIDPVAKAERSPNAAEKPEKAAGKRTANGDRCHSFSTLITELALQTRNTIRLQGSQATFDQITTPNALQARALELIENWSPSTRRHGPDTSEMTESCHSCAADGTRGSE